MLKKIFCAALTVAAIYFAAFLIFVNAAAAEDVWICNDGRQDYYVQTESLVNRTQYRDDRAFSVDVIIVRGLGAEKKNYVFRENDGLIYCNIDGGEDVYVTRDTPEEKIWHFGLDFLGINYEVRYD